MPHLLRTVTGGIIAIAGLLSVVRAQSGSVAPTEPPPPIAPPANLTPGSGIDPYISVSPEPVAIRTNVTDGAWSGAGIDVSQARGRFPARLINLSIRASLPARPVGERLIAGATISGKSTLPTLVRAVGPGLSSFGITNYLRGPTLSVYSGSTVAAETNTIAGTSATVAAYAGAFPAVGSSYGQAVGDAAIAGRPAPGMLTAHLTSGVLTGGVALLEFYDVDSAASVASPRFINFSARGRIESSGVIIAGFNVAGEGSVRLLLRGVGPSLSQFGIADALPDPTIELYANSLRVAANDSWMAQTVSPTEIAAATKAVGTFGLAPTEAALLVTLSAGSYTLHVSSVNPAQAGTALVEIYEY